jgi:hypothetical protein
MSDSSAAARPEYNVTGIDYAERSHFRYTGPIIDFHTHVLRTRPTDPVDGPPSGKGPGASLDQAATMLGVGGEFGIRRSYSMCFPDDIAPLRERFGDRLGFIGSISKQKIDDPDETAYKLLDSFLELGVEMIKFWSAPRGRDRGLLVDAPWRIEAARRARAAGVRLVMVHVADPDAWFRTVYADSSKYGSKPDQYIGLRRMLELFPDLTWIGAHMGGDSEHPDHLQALLEAYPNLYLDTSATKWQVREVSARREAVRSFICRHPDRFLFGTDLVTRHYLQREHYVSRYWCQRTLWESGWEGRGPIADADHTPTPAELQAGAKTPLLRGLELPEDVLAALYHDNAARLLKLTRNLPQTERAAT